MRFEDVLRATWDLPLVESSMLRVLGAGDPKALSVQLDRWTKCGKLVKLRRGAYLLGEPWSRARAPLERIANLLARPSYVTAERALALHGLIPETVPLVRSVTTGRSALLRTPAGTFDFRHVSPAWFFGYRETEVAGAPALVATPHKALLDLVALSRGEFDDARLAELRLQGLDALDLEALLSDASRSGSPRLIRAARRIARMAARAAAEEVEL